MEKKIDIAAILKDCPKGMELDCVLFDDVKFEECAGDCIYIRLNNGGVFALTKYGNCLEFPISKCVIFPKGKTTWEGFIPPFKFKDGDVIFKQNFIAIISYIESNGRIWYHCWYNKKYKECKIKIDFGIGNINDDDEIRFATEEEKQKLFDTLKSSGYKWNAETKTLEKLIIPKFKVGDTITNGKTYIAIGYIDDEYYYEINRAIAQKLCIKNQDEWKLVPNKFDINTLKTFDKVLVRETGCDIWVPKLFSHYETDLEMEYYIFVDIDNMGYPQCIPYEKNRHLCRTTDDCNKFYKVWE
jgi:hypothetical protein